MQPKAAIREGRCQTLQIFGTKQLLVADCELKRQSFPGKSKGLTNDESANDFTLSKSLQTLQGSTQNLVVLLSQEKMPGPILKLIFRPNVLRTFPGHDKISFMVVVRKSVLFVIVKFCNS